MHELDSIINKGGSLREMGRVLATSDSEITLSCPSRTTKSNKQITLIINLHMSLQQHLITPLERRSFTKGNWTLFKGKNI